MQKYPKIICWSSDYENGVKHTCHVVLHRERGAVLLRHGVRVGSDAVPSSRGEGRHRVPSHLFLVFFFFLILALSLLECAGFTGKEFG